MKNNEHELHEFNELNYGYEICWKWIESYRDDFQDGDIGGG